MRTLVSLAVGFVLAAPLPAMRAATPAAQSAAPPAAKSPALVELRDLNDLEARFNDDRGKTRIVLLVSPT